jgi:MFS family permease
LPETRRRSPIGIISLTVFLDILGFAVILPLIPNMLEYYLGKEWTTTTVGSFLDGLARASGNRSRENVEALFGTVLMGIYSVLQFLFAPFWGSLSDRIGRRPVLLVTIGGIAVSYLIWFFSGSFWLLVAARLLGGLMSGNISTASAAVSDATTPEERPKGMGMVGAAIGLGFTVGPVLGVAFNCVDLAAVFPSLQAIGVNPFSAAAAGSFLLAAGNWLWVWTRFEETLGPDQRGKAREARRTIRPGELFGRIDLPGVNLVCWMNFLYFVAFGCLESTLTFLAKHRFDYEPKRTGILMLFMGLVIVFARGGVFRQLAPQYGEKRMAAAGFCALIVGFLVVGWASKAGHLYLGLASTGLGSAFVSPALSSLVSLYAPAERQGMVLGVFSSLGALARAVGPLLAGALYWRFGASAPYLAASAIAIIPLALTPRLPAGKK